MLIYLDMCSIQRPLDDRTQLRVALEAEAVLGILGMCESGQAELISSDALEYETGENFYPLRQSYAFGVLAKASRVVRLSAAIEDRAGELNAAGFKPLDALHLASAGAAGVDYFCTCDDRLWRRARAGHPGLPRVVTPVELIAEIES